MKNIAPYSCWVSLSSLPEPSVRIKSPVSSRATHKGHCKFNSSVPRASLPPLVNTRINRPNPSQQGNIEEAIFEQRTCYPCIPTDLFGCLPLTASQGAGTQKTGRRTTLSWTGLKPSIIYTPTFPKLVIEPLETNWRRQHRAKTAFEIIIGIPVEVSQQTLQ